MEIVGYLLRTECFFMRSHERAHFCRPPDFPLLSTSFRATYGAHFHTLHCREVSSLYWRDLKTLLEFLSVCLFVLTSNENYWRDSRKFWSWFLSLKTEKCFITIGWIELCNRLFIHKSLRSYMYTYWNWYPWFR